MKELLIKHFLEQVGVTNNTWIKEEVTQEIDNGRYDFVFNLTKDIAIGFTDWVECSGSYFGSLRDGEWKSHYDTYENKNKIYTTEQLFNEYLNTLK